MANEPEPRISISDFYIAHVKDGNIIPIRTSIKRFSNDENAREALSHERTLIESEGNAFDTLFGFAKEEEEDGL